MITVSLLVAAQLCCAPGLDFTAQDKAPSVTSAAAPSRAKAAYDEIVAAYDADYARMVAEFEALYESEAYLEASKARDRDALNALMEGIERVDGGERDVARSELFVGRSGRGSSLRRPYSALRVDVAQGRPLQFRLTPLIAEKLPGRRWHCRTRPCSRCSPGEPITGSRSRPQHGRPGRAAGVGPGPGTGTRSRREVPAAAPGSGDGTGSRSAGPAGSVVGLREERVCGAGL